MKKMEEKILFEHKLVHSKIKFYQDVEGGLIWIRATGDYPMIPSDLEQILKDYVDKED